MNIEIANRLVQLRKSKGLSQEALAEKLGISRQAVSKWERAEASPDTDNLIMLAKLYQVSLDDLLFSEEENEDVAQTIEVIESDTERAETTDAYEEEDYVHVGFEGVHVKDKDGSEVHVGWDGIHINDSKDGDEVHVDKNGVFVNGVKYDKEWFKQHHHFPFGVIICVLYIFIGIIFGAWHPGWLLFLLIPLWYSLLEAVEKDKASAFAYPVLATLLFLCAGFFLNMWHPGWVIFLTVPLYYSLVSYLNRREREE